MTVIWTPDGVDPLVEAQEDERDVVATVTAEVEDDGSGDTDDVESLSWSADPEFPPQVVVETLGNVLTLTIPHFVDLFPIQEIRYLRNREPGVCYRWADLPEDAEDVFLYRADPVNIKTTVLTVTAHLRGGGTESQAYLIVVRANYSLGRDALVEAINARS